MTLEPVVVGLGWFADQDPEVRKARMDAYLTNEYGLCGCGKPVRYIVPNSDEPGACNKHARCPTYDELLRRVKELNMSETPMENSGSDGMMQFHNAVGTGAGVAPGPDGRDVPVVTMHFARDQSIIERMDSGDEEFNPDDDEHWQSFALSIRGARQLISDLKDAVDAAIQGPPKHG